MQCRGQVIKSHQICCHCDRHVYIQMGSSWYPSPQVEVFNVKLLGFLMFPWIQTCWVAACIFPGSLGGRDPHRLTARSARTMDVGLHAPYYLAVMMAVSCPIGGAWATQETWIDMDQDMDQNMDQLPSTVCLNTRRVERGIYCSILSIWGPLPLVHSFLVHPTRNLEWVQCF